MVDSTRIDDFVGAENIRPDFIKIDVEGAELEALNGAISCCQLYRPMLMVEMTRNQKEVHEFLVREGYVMFNGRREVMSDYQAIRGNIFCLHRENHRADLNSLGICLESGTPAPA